MSKKGLTSALRKALAEDGIQSESPLIAAYRSVVKEICGFPAHFNISDGDMQRFKARQDALDELEMDYVDYASSVVKTWWPWCRGKNMRRVSIPIFCGPAAWARYQKDHERHVHVTIDTLADDIDGRKLQEELVLVQMYVGWYPQFTIDLLRTILTPFYEFPYPDNKIQQEALRLINVAYAFNASCYEELAQQLEERCHHNDHDHTSTPNSQISIEDSGMSIEDWLANKV